MMKRSNTRGLIALNVALLAVLAVTVLGPQADAQRGQPVRARGQYTLIGGQIQGGNTNAVYILDSTNQELVVVRWSGSNKSLDGIGYRNLAADASSTRRGPR